jgi:hypothetical protein
MSFLGDKQRRTDFRRVPSISGFQQPPPRDAAVLLMEKALAVLDEQGWAKIRFKNRWGNVCLLGALRVADGGQARWPVHRSPAYHEAVARLNRVAQDRGYNRATFFNDDARTEYQDVVTLVQQAMTCEAHQPGASRS